MYSEQLAIMMFMAVSQMAGPQASPTHGPVAEGPRQRLIRAVKEPELMAALNLRAKRLEPGRGQTASAQTLLARAD